MVVNIQLEQFSVHSVKDGLKLPSKVFTYFEMGDFWSIQRH